MLAGAATPIPCIMLSAKQLLIQQTADAFDGRKDMSLMAALAGITQEEASWRAEQNLPTAEQFVRHVAWAKSWHCHQGFGSAMVCDHPAVNVNGDRPDLPRSFPYGV